MSAIAAVDGPGVPALTEVRVRPAFEPVEDVVRAFVVATMF